MTTYLFFAIAAGALLLGLLGYFLLSAIEEKERRDDLALRRLMDEELVSQRSRISTRLPTPV